MEVLRLLVSPPQGVKAKATRSILLCHLKTRLQLGEHHYRLGEVYWKMRGRYRSEKQFAYTQVSGDGSTAWAGCSVCSVGGNEGVWHDLCIVLEV